MKRIFIATLASIGLAFAGAASAHADHAQNWSANGDSFVVDETTVHLEGGNTSVETAALNVNVDAGEVVTFNYELGDGAECTGGAPRVFLVINGSNTNSWDQLQPTGEQCGVEGLVTFTAGNAGLITTAGIVYDNGGTGHVVVSNLTIGGEVVHFMNPDPDPEPDPEPEPEPEPKGEDPDPDPESEPKGEQPKDDEPKDDDTPAATKGGELPDTGGNTTVALLAAGALLVVGGGLFGLRRLLNHAGTYPRR